MENDLKKELQILFKQQVQASNGSAWQDISDDFVEDGVVGALRLFNNENARSAGKTMDWMVDTFVDFIIEHYRPEHGDFRISMLEIKSKRNNIDWINEMYVKIEEHKNNLANHTESEGRE